MDNHYDTIVFFKYLHIIVRQQIYRNFIFIIYRIPEVFSQFSRIIKSGYMPASVLILFYPQDDDSSITVSKSRVCLP